MDSFILAIHALLSVRAHFTDSPYWGAWWNETFIGTIMQAGGEYAADNSPLWAQVIFVATPARKSVRHANQDSRNKDNARLSAQRNYDKKKKLRGIETREEVVTLKTGAKVRRSKLQTIARCRRQLRLGENYPLAYVTDNPAQIHAAYRVFDALLTSNFDEAKTRELLAPPVAPQIRGVVTNADYISSGNH